jgi:hypothetical protein
MTAAKADIRTVRNSASALKPVPLEAAAALASTAEVSSAEVRTPGASLKKDEFFPTGCSISHYDYRRQRKRHVSKMQQDPRRSHQAAARPEQTGS